MCLPFGRARRCCPIVELRQYTLKTGQRDTLIELFEREFIEPQETLGMRLIGQFRDLDRPDRFVWLRGFSDLDARKEALAAFYDGPVWKAHREAANATMIDSDNVLLLRPAQAVSAFALKHRRERAERTPGGLIVAAVYSFAEAIGDELLSSFFKELRRALERTGGPSLATFVTEPGPNSFPRLPVREGEHVLVHFMRFASDADHLRHRERLACSASARDALAHFERIAIGAPQILRLSPAPRSLLR